MTFDEAKRIFDTFEKYKSDEGPALYGISSLPFSKASVRMAHFVVLESMIERNGILKDEVIQKFQYSYIFLRRFIDDNEAIRLNGIKERYKDTHDEEFKKNPEKWEECSTCYEYIFDISSPLGEDWDEIEAFIRDCYKKFNV